ncbi:molecular chaperone GrpE [Paenibacillus turicensis]|uniref:Protein GrpE n=1 Tax=Paenibacillus turicensis TaxID=160487 RepID=A0ABS4FPM2_9BACL|nr:molecular chaperone GrpE [Paenibacillus turicensis]
MKDKQKSMNINSEEETMETMNANQEYTDSDAVEDVNESTTVNQEEQAVDMKDNSELSKLQAELEEQQQRVLRTQADFDNFRRRTQKEKEDLAKYASSLLITELLPVIDNFERALSTGTDNPEVSSYAKGVEMIFRQLEGVLKAEGLEEMNSVGQPFNPEFHQAIMQVESDEYEEGIVVEEVQKGYKLKDRVLRPAMVKVSS